MARQKVKGLQAGGVYAPYTPPKRKAKIVEAEQLEMKGTPGPYNPRRVRSKKRITTPSITTTSTKKIDTGDEIRTKLSSAVDRAAAGKRAADKVYSRAIEAKAKLDRGKAAREKLYSGARKGSDPKEVAKRAPVTIKTLKPLARQVYDKPIGPPVPPLHGLLVEKTGGKVSRKRGKKIMIGYKAGGKV